MRKHKKCLQDLRKSYSSQPFDPSTSLRAGKLGTNGSMVRFFFCRLFSPCRAKITYNLNVCVVLEIRPGVFLINEIAIVAEAGQELRPRTRAAAHAQRLAPVAAA